MPEATTDPRTRSAPGRLDRLGWLGPVGWRRWLGWLPWAAVAAVLPLVLVAIRARLPESERLVFAAQLLYWTMPVVVVGAVAAVIWRCRVADTPWRAALRRWWPGLVAAAVLTAVVFVLVPPTMRVQSDETSLVNVSQYMHRHRATLMTTGAIPFEGAVVALENIIDKRPPLFAFLVSVVHDLTGPRVENAFLCNALLLGAALFLAFAVVRPRLGLAAGFAAPLLLLSVPLTTITATSAGFDLLAAVLLAVVLLAARDFVQRPDTVRGVTFLAIGMVFAQSRYESLFAFLLILGLVGLFVRGRWTPTFGTKAALAACPGLAVPLFFLLQIARNPNFYPEASGAPLLSVQHGLEHIGPFLTAWFSPSLGNPLPGVVGIVAVVAWGTWLVRGRATRGDLLVVVPVLAITTLVLCWFSGDVRDPIALRLYLACAWLTALSPLLLPAVFGPRIAPWLLGAALVLAGLRVDEVRRGVAFPRLDGARIMDAVEDIVAREHADPHTTLFVTTVAQHLCTMGRAALCPMSFVSRRGEIQQLLANGHLRRIYLVETPIDADLAGGFGDPADVQRSLGAGSVVARSDGDLPVVLRRLR